jgi:uncharacterized protein (DUF302 family)
VAMSPAGLICTASPHAPRETMDRLLAALRARGIAVLARIDHEAAAAEAGLDMRPAELLIFGDAHAGTPLMRDAPTMAIDLPLKALVWQDAAGGTWVAVNEPNWIAARHGAQAGSPQILAAMTAMLRNIVADAIAAG